jgi:hypothetical protein
VLCLIWQFHAHPTREFKMGELAFLTGFAPKVEQLIECKKGKSNPATLFKRKNRP